MRCRIRRRQLCLALRGAYERAQKNLGICQPGRGFPSGRLRARPGGHTSRFSAEIANARLIVLRCSSRARYQRPHLAAVHPEMLRMPPPPPRNGSVSAASKTTGTNHGAHAVISDHLARAVSVAEYRWTRRSRSWKTISSRHPLAIAYAIWSQLVAGREYLSSAA